MTEYDKELYALKCDELLEVIARLFIAPDLADWQHHRLIDMRRELISNRNIFNYDDNGVRKET